MENSMLTKRLKEEVVSQRSELSTRESPILNVRHEQLCEPGRYAQAEREEATAELTCHRSPPDGEPQRQRQQQQNGQQSQLALSQRWVSSQRVSMVNCQGLNRTPSVHEQQHVADATDGDEMMERAELAKASAQCRTRSPFSAANYAWGVEVSPVCTLPESEPISAPRPTPAPVSALESAPAVSRAIMDPVEMERLRRAATHERSLAEHAEARWRADTEAQEAAVVRHEQALIALKAVEQRLHHTKVHDEPRSFGADSRGIAPLVGCQN
eukprot:SAG11_NODE_6563_length_1288_cov_1.969722_1_plen_269_part_00